MSFGVGSGSTGWTVDVAANGGKGRETGSGTTWRESTVTAGNTLTIVSGGDTTIRGGQVAGNTVLANIGGDLTVQSLQDSNSYHSLRVDVVKKFDANGEPIRGNRTINDTEAEVVRRIFSDYAAGKSPKRVMAQLRL